MLFCFIWEMDIKIQAVRWDRGQAVLQTNRIQQKKKVGEVGGAQMWPCNTEDTFELEEGSRYFYKLLKIFHLVGDLLYLVVIIR